MCIGTRSAYTPQIFLTHSGADRRAASGLAEALERAFDYGLHVYCSSRPDQRIAIEGAGAAPPEKPLDDLPHSPDESLQALIQEQLTACDEYLVLATANAMLRGNNWVSVEIQFSYRIRVRPLVLIARNTGPGWARRSATLGRGTGTSSDFGACEVARTSPNANPDDGQERA
jgi:hypothetical protein